MIKTADAIPGVEKEIIKNLHFPPQEVLLRKEKIAGRRSELEKAMRLGNMFKTKVRIVFEDAEGLKTVETTIWNVSDKNVILKNEIAIPIHRIHYIII